MGKKRVLCLHSPNAIHRSGRSLQGEHPTVHFGYTSGNQLIHGGSKKAPVTFVSGDFWICEAKSFCNSRDHADWLCLRMAAYALLCYFLVGTSNFEGGQSDEKV